MSNQRLSNPSRVVALVLATAFAAATMLAVLILNQGAAEAAKVSIVMGKTNSAPDPACPRQCQAIASQTSYQLKLPSNTTPFQADSNGKITKWSITLSKPNKKQRNGFNKAFGGPPQAGIGILHRVGKNRGAPKFRLAAKSRIKALGRYFGRTVTFRLRHALRIHKHDMVALIVPTWAPAFGLSSSVPGSSSSDYVRRSSISRKKCSSDFARTGWHPQVKRKSKRTYACKFTAAQLLYTATFVGRG